ncbi:hypothetical protein Lal_00039237 [Lupinus albus]|nr:hypothetical protein Lal_00039237 [Lupinus albus]
MKNYTCLIRYQHVIDYKDHEPSWGYHSYLHEDLNRPNGGVESSSNMAGIQAYRLVLRGEVARRFVSSWSRREGLRRVWIFDLPSWYGYLTYLRGMDLTCLRGMDLTYLRGMDLTCLRGMDLTYLRGMDLTCLHGMDLTCLRVIR